MVTTISELQQLCAEQGVALPALRQAATATDGTPVYTCEITGTDAFRLWHDLRALHDRSRWWPVLAGEPQHLPNVFVGLKPDFAAPEGQTDDRPLDGRTLLANWAREAEGYLSDPNERTPPGEDPFEAPAQRLTAHVAKELDLDLVGGTHFSALRQERTVVCLVRARNGYDIPALLNWLGACNYGITGEEHQAVLCYFHEEHGAELVTLEDQVLELLVTRRPRTPKDVAHVALEHYAYCSDIVDQGTGSIEELAASQLRSKSWYFWWD